MKNEVAYKNERDESVESRAYEFTYGFWMG